MENLTLRLEEEKIEELDKEADDAGVSRSEYIRRILSRRHESGESDEETVSQAEYSAMQMQCYTLIQTISTYNTQVERLTDENDRLTRQLEADEAPALEENSGGWVSRLRQRLTG